MKRLRYLIIMIILLGGLFTITPQFISDSNIMRLPLPQFTGDQSLQETLTGLTTAIQFTSEPLTINTLSQLLWAAQGITDPILQFRAIPSAGALYPLELYIILEDAGVRGLSGGIYHYSPAYHQLQKTQSSFNLRSELANLLSDHRDRELVRNAPVTLIIAAEYARTIQKYGDRSLQYVHLEVGCAAQQLALQAVAHELSVALITRFDATAIQTWLDAPTPLLIIPIGIPAQSYVPKKLPILNISQSDHILLPPILAPDDHSLEEAILRRRSIREYNNESLTVHQLRYILNAVENVVTITQDLHVETLLCVGEVLNLSQGVYRVVSHGYLQPLMAGDVRKQLAAGAGASSPWVQTGKACLILLTIPDPLAETEQRTRIEQFTIGMISQNIHLQVAALNLGTVTVGAFNDTQILTAVNFTAPATPWFLMPIGYRVS